MTEKTPQTCGKCAGAGKMSKYNPATKRIEDITCMSCAGTGTVYR